MLHVTTKGRRALLQIEVKYKAETINTAEYMDTKCKEERFVNVAKSHKSNQQI